MEERKQKPEVSVIVPVYMAEQYIDRCINSILAQTFRNLELILVDDGSPDKCGEICDDFAKTDVRINVIHSRNMGVSHARNLGIDAAQGKYIIFVDSDDWVEPEHIEKLLPEADEDLVYCGYKGICDGESEFLCRPGKLGIFTDKIKDNFSEFWSENALYFVWRGCYNLEIIKRNQIAFNEDSTVGEDLLFNLQYLRFCNSIRFSDETHYCHDNVSFSVMHQYHPNILEKEKHECESLEWFCEGPWYRMRWYCWHSAIGHYKKWEQSNDRWIRENAKQNKKEAFEEPYFRECIPYIRKHGTLDEKIETFFMSAWAHPLYKPFYSIIAALSRLKNAVLKRK